MAKPAPGELALRDIMMTSELENFGNFTRGLNPAKMVFAALETTA
jgi:hypothetical protein